MLTGTKWTNTKSKKCKYYIVFTALRSDGVDSGATRVGERP